MSLMFKVGNFTIHRIVKYQKPAGPALAILPSLTPELLAENRNWLRQASALDDNDELIMCIQSYVIKTPHHTVLVDTCIGNDKCRSYDLSFHMKTDDTYKNALNAAGFMFDHIDIVMCTHLHDDHVGWNTRLKDGCWVPTFPKARYIFARAEFDYWDNVNKSSNPAFLDSVLPVVEAGRAQLVDNEQEIADGIRIMPAHGHTPGHAVIALGRTNDEAVFIGDLMHSPLQAAYPELSSKWDMDPQLAAATRRNFLEHYIDTDTLFFTAHFPAPSVGKIRRKGNGFACETT
ncbi:MBL fold metallo-hydrolase [Bradyrhizobium sp. USDA 223]|uniref:MBL fold metallo-hydrolase n=1 Tax=Bradyrhizobium sp. USDA 223 TaxID=3156306 RepID=UPI003839A8CF